MELRIYSANTREMLPFYPIQWREEMEIVKVRSGKGIFYVDGKKYFAEAGDIVILHPFAMYSISRVDGSDMAFDAIVFNLRLLERSEATHTLKFFAPLLNEKNSVPCIARFTDSWYHPFEQSLTSILTCDVTAEDAEENVNANLRLMFHLIYNNRLTNFTQNLAEDKQLYTVRRALEYIRTEYINEITVGNIAHHCGYSEFYMMKLFKQFTGESIVDYINHYRLTVAGQQLRDTHDDIAKIARQVGYNNISYFNRQFKKLYGATPREFRASPTWQVD